MRRAIVVAVHPERRSADIVYADTAMPVAEVQFAGWVASDGGHWHIPSVPKPATLQASASPSDTGRKLIALVDHVDGRPVIIGFLQTAAGQMAFTQQDREVHRHSSGAYSTIAPDGSMEFYHPSGSYIRMGAGAHEPLAPISANQKWQEVTTAAVPTVTIATPKCTITVDPDGNVSINAQGAGTMTFPNGLTINAKTKIVGDTEIDGILNVTGAITGGFGGGSVDLLTHIHHNGGSTTGGPVVGT